MKLVTWQRLSLALSAAAAAAAAVLYFVKGWGPAEVFVALLAVVFAGWAGALAGSFIEWKRGGAPFGPFFKERFGWYYRRGYWFRFAVLFGFALFAFFALAAAVALMVGEKEEARLFFTQKGALVLAIFLAVFAFLGALIGGLIDLVGYLMKK